MLVSVNIKMLRIEEAPRLAVGEAPVADALDELLDQENPTVATYAKDDGCLIRVTAAAADHDAAMGMIEPVIAEIRHRLGDEYIRYIREELPE